MLKRKIKSTKGERSKMDREDELRKALGIEEPSEEKEEGTTHEFKEEVRIGILNRAAKKLVDERKERSLKPKPKGDGRWHFSLGRYRWGFWLMTIGFLLFLLFQFVIRPLLTGG